MTRKHKKLFIAVLFCAGILAASAGLYAFEYKDSENKPANEYFKTGLLYNTARQYKRAIPYFEKAIDADPEFAASFFEAAFALQNSADKEKAIAYYEKGLELEKNFSQAYSQIAVIYIEKGEVLKSYQWLKKGQSIYPENKCINMMISFVQKRYGAALALAEEAQKNGSNVVLGQAGKGVFIGPRYYQKGEKPVSLAEQKLFDEYTGRLQHFQDNNIDEKYAWEQLLKWYAVVFKEYNTNAKDFNHMLRKIAYGEIPPESYIPPWLDGQD